MLQYYRHRVVKKNGFVCMTDLQLFEARIKTVSRPASPTIQHQSNDSKSEPPPKPSIPAATAIWSLNHGVSPNKLLQAGFSNKTVRLAIKALEKTFQK